MTQATCRATAMLVAMVGIGLVAAQAAQADELADFFIQAPTPQGWTPVALEGKLPNFGGKILAMWERQTDHGRAAIYVVGQRTKGQLLLEVTADLFAGDLEESGIPFNKFPDTVVMGRPAARIALSGMGDGRMLTALDEDIPDKQRTYMELLMLTHFWADGTGTDFIELAVGCPDEDKFEIVPQFRKMVAGCRFTGQYGKPAAERPTPSPQGATAPSVSEPTGTTEPPSAQGGALASPSTRSPANPSPSPPTAPAPSAAQTAAAPAGSKPTAPAPSATQTAPASPGSKPSTAEPSHSVAARAGAGSSPRPATAVTAAENATSPPRSLAAEMAAVAALNAAGFSAYWSTEKNAAYDLRAVPKDGSRVVKLVVAVAAPVAKAADPLVWRIPVERAQSADFVLLSTYGGGEVWVVPFAQLKARGKIEDGVLTLVGSDMGADEATVYEFLQEYRNVGKVLGGGK